MATADTQSQKPRSSRRRLQNTSLENDFIPADAEPPARPPPLSRSQSHRERPTKQLDFYQAMSDFKAMFPTMDSDVIEAVLRSNDGAVDDTIDQLLTMTIDAGDKDGFVDIPPELLSPQMEKSCPSYHEKRTEDSPPSYTEAVRSNDSIWTTPIVASKSSPTLPKRSPNRSSTTPKSHTSGHSHNKSLHHHSRSLDQTRLSDHSRPTEQTRSSEHTRPLDHQNRSSERHSRSSDHHSRNSSHHHHRRSHRSRHTEDTVDSLSLSNTEPKRPLSFTSFTQNSPTNHNTSLKRGFRNWNPPMLGTLPDDFLRLTVPKSCSNNMSLDDFIQASEQLDFPGHPNLSRKERHSERHSNSTSEHRKKVSRSRSERAPDRPRMHRNGDHLPLVHSMSNVQDFSPGMSKSLVISSHEFSQDMLDEKLKENERRRRKAVKNVDLEMSQYLEDERLAIALQNSEFLQELRGNEDFMKTLEKDRMNLSAFEQPAVQPEMPVLPSEQITYEGYGDDKQQQLEAFPFSQPSPKNKDEDAELRRQLKHMGGASRKQFMALAKKFFSRKKKKMTLKQIQKEKLAPSMINLLDSDEEDFVPEDSTNPYNQTTEIEPLPDSLLRIPNHKTVQRPMYNPNTTVTYHDNKASDCV